MKDPILESNGILADVARRVPTDLYPVEVLRVGFTAQGPQESKLSLTILTAQKEKHILECPVRAEVYEVVRRFFEKKSSATASGDITSAQLPPRDTVQSLLMCAEGVVAHIQARPEVHRSRESLAHALGDAIGVAVIVGAEGQALELAVQLKKTLHITPGSLIKPSVTRDLLNGLAPVIRASVASDRLELLCRVMEQVVPATCEFDGTINEGADMRRFSSSLLDLMNHGVHDDVAHILSLFNEPNVQLLILNLATEAVIAAGTVQGINTCGKVVRAAIKDCEGASCFTTEQGWRVRAFSYALAGKLDAAEDMIDQVFRWSRGDEVLGWVLGVTTGFKIRAKHDFSPKEFLPHLKSVLYLGNEDYFDVVAPAFVRGLLSASQGARAEVANEILHALTGQYPELREKGEYSARKVVQHLLGVARMGSTQALEEALKTLPVMGKSSGVGGDRLFLALCNEVATDATIRDPKLRRRIVEIIVEELNNPRNVERYPLTRIRAADVLFAAGYEAQALAMTPSPTIGEIGRLIWRVRAATSAERSGETIPQSMITQVSEDIDALAQLAGELDKVITPIRADAWSPLVEEIASVANQPLIQKTLHFALRAAGSWTVEEVSKVNDALLNGLVRRAYSHDVSRLD